MAQYDVYKFLSLRKNYKWMTNLEISLAIKKEKQIVIDATRKLFESGFLERRRIKGSSFYNMYEYRRVKNESKNR